MAGKVMRRPGIGRKLKALHEHTALAGLAAIAIHGITLLGDRWLHPGVTGILVPFSMGYRPVYTGLGILAGYLAAALGLTFYAADRRIGARLWRKAHRATVVVYLLGLVHVLGAGTDAELDLAARLHARDRHPDRTAVPAPHAAAACHSRPWRRRRGRERRRRHRRRWTRGPTLHPGPAPQGLRRPADTGGAEAHLPYDRPPLSKELLAGAVEPAQVALRPEAWYAERALSSCSAGRRSRCARASTRSCSKPAPRSATTGC